MSWIIVNIYIGHAVTYVGVDWQPNIRGASELMGRGEGSTYLHYIGTNFMIYIYVYITLRDIERNDAC